MEIEQLKMVLEAMEGLGDGAQKALATWLFFIKVPGFVLGLGWLGLVFTILVKGGRIIQDMLMVKEFQRRLCLNGILIDSERQEIRRVFVRGVKATKDER